MFPDPADETNDQENSKDENLWSSHSGPRVYIPKSELKFDQDGRLQLFEVSKRFTTMKRLALPTHFFAFTSSLSMMDSIMTMHYLSAFAMGIPFFFLMAIGNFFS